MKHNVKDAQHLADCLTNHPEDFVRRLATATKQLITVYDAPQEPDHPNAVSEKLEDAYKWIRHVVERAPDRLYVDTACAQCEGPLPNIEGFVCVPHRALAASKSSQKQADGRE